MESETGKYWTLIDNRRRYESSFFCVINEKIEQYGEVYIYQEIDDFTGIEIDAIVEKFKYLFENGISNITRIAVVTDKQWLQKIVDLEDKLFKSIDMQYFAQ